MVIGRVLCASSQGMVLLQAPSPNPKPYTPNQHKDLKAKPRMPQGKLIVRFDDTNPSKEKMEFEESMIKEPPTSLGCRVQGVELEGYGLGFSSDDWAWGVVAHIVSLTIKLWFG